MQSKPATSISKALPKLCVLTTDLAHTTHQALVLELLKGGVRFIQVRSKNLSKSELLKQLIEVRKMTHDYDCLMIVNDYLELALEVAADGVHLGRQDTALDSAIKDAEGRLMIGATCNNQSDFEHVSGFKINYIGLGPYKDTATKRADRLAARLGIDGINQLSAENQNLPIYAIGGIKLDDLEQLSQSNCYGLAVCAAIVNRENIKLAAMEFLNEVDKWYQTN